MQNRYNTGVYVNIKSIVFLWLMPSLVLLVGCGEVSNLVDAPAGSTMATFTSVPSVSMDTATGKILPISSASPGPSSSPVPLGLRGIRVERVFSDLDFQKLTNLTQPDDGGDHMFVTEQAGLVHLFLDRPQVAETKIFLDIRHKVSEGSRHHREEGLLGLAFDPQYSRNGYFYVYYSATDPRRSIVSRFSVHPNDPEVADPGSEIVVIEVSQPYGNHNGGQLAFGPDGYLYIGLGDGGSAWDPQRHGQNIGTVLGSILRIDVRYVSEDNTYSIPPDNPFLGDTKIREEIWAYGLRNPWRFSFDSETNLLWAGDVGQDSWEEINLVKKGLNYGWSIAEGHQCLKPDEGCEGAGLEFPVAEYNHAEGCSITGGYVYRGANIPWLVGTYIYGDFCTGKISGLRYFAGAVVEQAVLLDTDLSISSFGQTIDGALYILSRNDGIYRMFPEQ